MNGGEEKERSDPKQIQIFFIMYNLRLIFVKMKIIPCIEYKI